LFAERRANARRDLGAWWKANVLSEAKTAVARSAQRYLRMIGA
jgi:hypothetical protein